MEREPPQAPKPRRRKKKAPHQKPSSTSNLVSACPVLLPSKGQGNGLHSTPVHPYGTEERPVPCRKSKVGCAKAAAAERGEVVEEEQKRAKKIKVGKEGYWTRVDCALNNLYDREEEGVRRCNYIQPGF